MKPAPSPVPPVLAAPGAGLPAIELVIARFLFHTRRRLAPRAAVEAAITAEHGRIAARVGACDAAGAGRRVLIPRLRGMEDSSRHWSVWMTLDHLRIVNTGIVRTIGELLAGRTPPGQADTATVKPSPEVDQRVVAAFDESCAALLRAGQAAASLATAARYAHPWFGPLDAEGWKFLGAFHLALHRRQIEAILRGLAAEPA